MTSHDLPGRPISLNRAAWRKSTRTSGGGNGNCVEAADLSTIVAVRDSTLTDSGRYPVLTVDRGDWPGFLAAISSTA